LAAAAATVLAATVLIHAQAPPEPFQQGSPACTSFDQGGGKCGRVSCYPIAFHINTTCSTPLSQQGALLGSVAKIILELRRLPAILSQAAI
jgi:hypothetical protein